MTLAAQPTVEVITAGTDWAAIAAAIATGLAAIIGIAGTAWQAGRARRTASVDLQASLAAAAANQQASIKAAAENLRAGNDAEDRRALRAEKIRVYSEFQGSLDNLRVADANGAREEAIAAVNRSAAAVTLIAPEHIGALARDLARGNTDIDTIDDRQELYRLMRTDLGTDRD